MYFYIYFLLLLAHVITATLMKRGKVHEKFPDYSLRYTHPKLCDTSKHTSGYFELPDGKNFFFWFIESRAEPGKDPVTIWLNGGPGCSSEIGQVMEVGPCRVNKEGNGLLNNMFSWTNYTNMLFLDQPVNSGYSYQNSTEKIIDSNTASEDVYIFLQLFYQEFPQFNKSDLHIAGESYAGHFLPAIGTTIHLQNTNQNHNTIPLKSLIIGNGLTDPLTQYQYYQPMACTATYGEALITDEKMCQQLERDQKECQKEIEKCYQLTNFSAPEISQASKDACITAAGICNALVVRPILNNTKRNIYDIRKSCEEGPMCYDYFTSIKTYFENPATKSLLGVDPSRQFELCSTDINAHFQSSGDWMRPYIFQLSHLLNNGINVLAYVGDTDLMCNWRGIDAWTKNLMWRGQADYNLQNDVELVVRQEVVGTVRRFGELAFVKVSNAGHMAPYDQPLVVLEMFQRWISSAL